jgi:phosphoglycolate phosphatase-like HAD superfamily hydrolase
MKPTVLLFDIDGTLLDTGGAGRRAILRALALVGIDTSPDFSFAGMTDRAIVRRFLVETGRTATEAAIDAVIAGYLEVLGDEVASSQRYRLHDGMLEAIDAADGRAGVALGLGTGNVERGARIKLGRAGVAHRFAFGGFGCDAEDRAELLEVGARRGAARLGVARGACRVVVVGDTPKDVAAAHAIGAEALAVATGSFDVASLRACNARWVFPSIAHPEAVNALLRSE